MSDTIKYLLPETEIPKDWYNIVADLPEPPPQYCILGQVNRWVLMI